MVCEKRGIVDVSFQPSEPPSFVYFVNAKQLAVAFPMEAILSGIS